MIDAYTEIGIIFALMSIGSAWMFLYARLHYLIKIVAISLVVAGTIYCWSSVHALIGFSIIGYPDDGSIVLAFSPDKAHNQIDIWIRDNKEGKARGYVFPYDDKFLKALKEGKQKAEKKNLLMKFYRNPPEDGDGGDGSGSGKDEGGKGKGKGKVKGQHGKGTKGDRDSDEESIFGDDIGPGFDIRLVPGLPPKYDDDNNNNNGEK